MNPPLPDGLPPLTCKCGWKGTQDQSSELGGGTGFCPRCSASGYIIPLKESLPLPEEDAKTEGEPVMVSHPLMRYPNGDPVLVPAETEIGQLRKDLAESRAEVEKWIQIANDRSHEATEWTRKFIDQRDRAVALREENKRLREGLTYIGHGYTQGSADMKRKARETLGLPAAPENQGEGGEG